MAVTSIHNLSKFASAKGFREQLHFKTDYVQDESAVRKMFNSAFYRAVANDEINIEDLNPLEIGVFETGDHAVKWWVYYYTKQVRSLTLFTCFYQVCLAGRLILLAQHQHPV